MTDLDSPRRNNDCYFYYYSTCAKGDNCTFRHEPSALGCETMCSFWKEGKCLNVHCNFRHMELRKNRKVIPCYWESQPGGCLKPHCPFLHQHEKPTTADESLESKTDSGTESADNTMNDKLNQMSDKIFNKKAPVDSLVVNFEEESDNESATSNSPNKSNHPHRVVNVKTLEEIRLEKIQAESAAYYSYPIQTTGIEESIDEQFTITNEENGDDLRQRILQRLRTKQEEETKPVLISPSRKRPVQTSDSLTNERNNKKLKTNDLSTIKIKTLDEIRAERLLNKSTANKESPKRNIDDCDSSVSSSTCLDDSFEDKSTKSPSNQRKKRIKLKRHCLDENLVTSAINNTSRDEIKSENTRIEEISNRITDYSLVETVGNSEGIDSRVIKSDKIGSGDTIDEVLLLDDIEDDEDVSLKAEEDLLNEIDDLLDN